VSTARWTTVNAFDSHVGESPSGLFIGVVRGSSNNVQTAPLTTPSTLSGPRSPIGDDSRPGQVPLHSIRQGLMLPPINTGLGGFTHLSWVILTEIPDGSMPTHTKGREGNLPVRTQI
jgi:hypothetical protein